MQALTEETYFRPTECTDQSLSVILPAEIEGRKKELMNSTRGTVLSYIYIS